MGALGAPGCGVGRHPGCRTVRVRKKMNPVLKTIHRISDEFETAGIEYMVMGGWQGFGSTENVRTVGR